MLLISLFFSSFRILFGGFGSSCYFHACTMVYMGRDRSTSGKYKRQGPLVLWRDRVLCGKVRALCGKVRAKWGRSALEWRLDRAATAITRKAGKPKSLFVHWAMKFMVTENAGECSWSMNAKLLDSFGVSLSLLLLPATLSFIRVETEFLQLLAQWSQNPFVEARLSRGLEGGDFFPSILLRSLQSVGAQNQFIKCRIGDEHGFNPLGTAGCLRRSPSWRLFGWRSPRPLTQRGSPLFTDVSERGRYFAILTGSYMYAWMYMG
jgi:hypothetical protein